MWILHILFETHCIFFLIIKKFLKNVCIYIPIETPPKKQKIFILFRVELLKH